MMTRILALTKAAVRKAMEPVVRINNAVVKRITETAAYRWTENHTDAIHSVRDSFNESFPWQLFGAILGATIKVCSEHKKTPLTKDEANRRYVKYTFRGIMCSLITQMILVAILLPFAPENSEVTSDDWKEANINE